MVPSIAGAIHLSVPDQMSQEIDFSTNLAVPGTFFECIPDTDEPAIRSVEDCALTLNYRALREFLLGTGNLLQRGIERADRVAIVMPNGPELAVAIMVCTCQCTAAPLDPGMAHEELAAALGQLGVRHCIALQHRQAFDGLLPKACEEAGCELHFVRRREGAVGLFDWAAPPSTPPSLPCEPRLIGGNDVALLLRTSGTTSKPKVVPLSPCGLYVGAVCMGQGLRLTNADVSLNVMPYTHIGGISCSLLATLFSGGSVICAPIFDPMSFLNWLETLRPTWYYAVPTIHKAVALSARGLDGPPKHNLRFIRSGAANLPDQDARDLRELFACTVLPTYSMSECMPIAQPPLEYDLGRPGSVGVPIACSLRIAGDSGSALAFGEVGEVCIRGPVVTCGYLDNAQANSECFHGDASEGMWFRTGDIGYLDQDGFLYLTGRSKELIKRGGDQVSPYEVEEALLAHPAVETALVFGVPNDFWGEEVAAAVVLKSGHAPVGEDITTQLRLAAHSLPDHKLPRQFVILESTSALPKTRTGKYVRTDLARHLGVQAVDLAAANQLAGGAAREETRKPVKPHRAIYGLRYLFAVWVVFVHMGPSTPDWLAVWKVFSASMPGYFILAGFLLASSYSGPMGSKLDFYKNRLVAAHPLYLLATLYTVPLMLLLCPPGGGSVLAAGSASCGLLNRGVPGAATVPGTYADQLVYVVVVQVLGQTAWPWGLVTIYLGFMDGVLWFSSAYYFCLLCFPVLHKMSSSYGVSLRRSGTSCIWPLAVAWMLVTVFSYAAWTLAPILVDCVGRMLGEYGPKDTSPMSTLATLLRYIPDAPMTQNVANFFAYTFPPTWAAIFFLGMLLYKSFEANAQGRGDVWPHWGRLTDATSVLMGLTLVFGSLLLEVSPENEALNNITTVYIAWGGDAPIKLVTSALCVWIYGLAKGQGLTARLMGSSFLVTYLSPAAYSVYLFHYPTAMYYFIIKEKILGPAAGNIFNPKSSLGGLVDYFLILASATLIALLAAHKLNAPITSIFMKLIERVCWCCCGCCRQSRPEQELSTLEQVAKTVKGLTGADVDASTPILECGLDSFGTSALVGMLRPKFPGLRISPLEVYQLENVGALVKRIDEDQGRLAMGQASADGASDARAMRAPLVDSEGAGV
mmetsp:Transcript_102546/g.289611  ORF Transcript_102546/g.289611 Transcript_102546/m.289611 type:complete len:1144 (-) Transcript_102546:47-3478(-)